jgi:hypothetical protein
MHVKVVHKNVSLSTWIWALASLFGVTSVMSREQRDLSIRVSFKSLVVSKVLACLKIGWCNAWLPTWVDCYQHYCHKEYDNKDYMSP